MSGSEGTMKRGPIPGVITGLRAAAFPPVSLKLREGQCGLCSWLNRRCQGAYCCALALPSWMLPSRANWSNATLSSVLRVDVP